MLGPIGYKPFGMCDLGVFIFNAFPFPFCKYTPQYVISAMTRKLVTENDFYASIPNARTHVYTI